MADDWRVGDLALCTDNSVAPFEARAGELVVDRIYKVSACGVPHGVGFLCLAFRDIPNSSSHGVAFNANRFRKVRPDKHEPCENEFVILLNLSKKRVAS